MPQVYLRGKTAEFPGHLHVLLDGIGSHESIDGDIRGSDARGGSGANVANSPTNSVGREHLDEHQELASTAAQPIRVAAGGWSVRDREARYPTPPLWVTKALDLGFRSRAESSTDNPFFGLISTPCDSCMAGLIALGAVLRALSLRQPGSRAVDRTSYFDYLRALRVGTVLRSRDHPRRKYALLQGATRNGDRPEFLRARRLNIGHEQVVLISELNCLNWWPEEDVPEAAGGYDGMWLPSEAATLRSLLPAGEEIRDDRLRLNCDDVVLVGPPGGAPAFRSVYEEHCSIAADNMDSFVPLSHLLGFRGWSLASGRRAWRGVYINALSPEAVAESKAAAHQAVLAVFDGAAPFLKLGDYFCRSDRIVVASRSLSNSLLERFCSKLYQDQHDSGAVAENGSTWLADLPPAIQAYRSRPPRREAAK